MKQHRMGIGHAIWALVVLAIACYREYQNIKQALAAEAAIVQWLQSQG